MSASTTKVRIFISSPGDVTAERDALENLIKTELQLTLGRRYNLYLEPLRWETYVTPGMGDIQQKVFEEMGAYDIFIGIFWKRFGTPTAEHESGSEAEFRDAYARWEQDNSRPVMLYFCQRPFMPETKESLTQMGKVLDFRQEIENKGLYSTYKEISEFERLLSRHLFDTITGLIPPPASTPETEPEKNKSELQEPGPLDALPLPVMDLPASPYRRLQWFRREDAGVFFGRDHEIRVLYDAITRQWLDPIVLFYGESGVGKSSLLAAGLLPRLEASHEVRYERRDRTLGLAGTLAKSLGDTSWQEAERQVKRPLVVILDQVEECYTRPMNNGPDAEIAAFVAQIAALFANPQNRPQGRLVLSFRKEWIADVESWFDHKAEGSPSLPFNKIFLERLGMQGIQEIVLGPTSTERLRHKYKIDVEPNLAGIIGNKMLEDRQSPVAPTLSILLAQMWEEAKAKNEARPGFTEDLYVLLAAKGVLLRDFVDEQLDVLASWNADIAESGLVLDVLNYHTTPLGTAESRTQTVLDERYADRERVEALVHKCQEAYLLVGLDSGTRLAHDTLAPLIRQRYRESNRPGQRAERLLQSRLPGWKQGKRGLPLDRHGLKEVEAGTSGMRNWTKDEKRMVKASRRERTKFYGLQAGLTGVFVLLVALAWGLFQNTQKYNACSEAGNDAAWCQACIDAGGAYNSADENRDLFCKDATFTGINKTSDFVRIEAGTFPMGSDSTDVWAPWHDELSRHEVTIAQPILLGKYEVTQAQWYAVLKNNPSSLRGDELPVTDVSWDEVQVFLRALNEQEGCSPNKPCYRLPTEAEWEYAACGGKPTAYGFGNDATQLGNYAWFNENSDNVMPVGQKEPIEGLFDMHGNVWEWTQTAYTDYPYDATDGREDLLVDAARVVRGGSWGYFDDFARCAYRNDYDPYDRSDVVGFRIVLLP